MCPAVDATLMMQPLRRSSHGWQHGLNAANRPEIVGLHDGTEVRERKLLDRTHPLDARVVDEHVDWSHLLRDAADGVSDGLVVIDIHHVDSNRQVFVASNFRKYGCLGGVAHRRCDLVARSAECQRRREAYAATGARNQNVCQVSLSSPVASLPLSLHEAILLN
jgi:hypothetical protein